MVSLLCTSVIRRGVLRRAPSFGIFSQRIACEFSSHTCERKILIVDFLPLVYKYFYGAKNARMSIDRGKAVALGVSKFGFPISPEGDPEVSTGKQTCDDICKCMQSVTPSFI